MKPLAAANTAFATAVEKAEGGAKEDAIIKKDCRKELTTLLSELAEYVQYTSKGVELVLTSSGFELLQQPEPVGPLPKAQGFKVKMGVNEGSVVLSCKAIPKAKVYAFEYTDAPATTNSKWTKSVSSKHKMQIDGLTSGQQYVFRVAGVGSDPTRNWSDKIVSYVL